MEWHINQNEATYILRYYLPCEPIYDYGTSCRRMDDLISYCIQNKVGAVMLYVDLNPYWYYMPDDVKHTEYYVSLLKELSNKLRENNISYQLNYQNLFGAWDGGADLRYVNGWENYVDELGKESGGCACMAGERFRMIAGVKLKAWAETKPDAIWIDDDIRLHNHRTSIRDLWAGKIAFERKDFGCFCEKHIELFNQKYHTSYTREEIVQGILNGEDQNQLRTKWLAFSGECVEDVAVWIEKTIHEVSPDTRIAIMTSHPDVHSVEGRNWNGFLTKLSGDGKPLLRPTFGPYAENDPREFFDSYLLPEHLKANIKSQYKEEFDFCPEIENTRFTRWSKSIAGTGFQIMLSAFLGCRGVTLSIYDLEGCVLEEEPEFGQLLREKRAFADNLAKLDLWNWESDGIGLVTAPDRLDVAWNKKRGSEINQLAKGRFWDRSLLLAGIPCKYITPDQLSACSCVALDEYTANMLSDEEILQILSRGLLLDVGAAEVLESRGFGMHVGVKVGETVHCIAASEVLHGYTHRDGSEVRVPARIDGKKWNELILEGAEAIITLITPYGTGYPGFTRFENTLGGKVYVYAGKGALGDGFYSNYRVKMLKDICHHIADDYIYKVNNVSYALTAVKCKENNAAVFVANLSTDQVKALVIEAPYPVKEAVILTADGRECHAQVCENKICCGEIGLHTYDAFVCKLKLK